MMPAHRQSDGPPAPASPDRSGGVKAALIVVLLLNAVSATLKIGVGARTGALTVLGAALESALDMLSNGVAILAVSIASRAPDDDHPYGHEKFETLGTLGIVAFLAITCFELLRQSIGELVRGHGAPSASWTDGWLLVASLAVNAFVVIYERRRGRALGSGLLLADASLGILVAMIIAWSGFQILRGSIPILVDARAVEAERLSAIVRTIPGVAGVRSARSRRTTSGHFFAEITILVDGSTSVAAAHDFTDEVERAITRELGAAEAIVHVEPA
jgi:divalent metal cation (Fe/Co/Zn/Cd) transporter